MPRYRMSRRTVLRGLGGTAVGLPLLDAMHPGTVRAAEQTKPTVRMAYLYFPNGVAEGAWEPKAVGQDGTIRQLNDWMQPLEPFKQDLIIPVCVP